VVRYDDGMSFAMLTTTSSTGGVSLR
jgi:hypothetical protein